MALNKFRKYSEPVILFLKSRQFGLTFQRWDNYLLLGLATIYRNFKLKFFFHTTAMLFLRLSSRYGIYDDAYTIDVVN